MKSEDVGLIVRAISFQKFSNLRAPDSPKLQTDGRTDGRHAIAKRSECSDNCVFHRAEHGN